MRAPRFRPGGDSAAQAATFLACVAIGFSAWAYGGTERWAIYGLAGLALASVLAGTVARTVDPNPLANRESWALPFLALVVFIAIQALNPSHIYSPLDQGLTHCEHRTFLPRTVSRTLTVQALVLLSALAALFWVIRSTLPATGIRIIIGTVIVSATAMALLSIFQGGDRARWELVGRFLNENSYAAYANLVFPVTLGAGRALARHAHKRRRQSHPGGLLYVFAGVMAASVLFCGSRAGAVVTVMILTSWVILDWRDSRRARGRSLWWMRPLLPLLPMLGLLALVGVEVLSSEVAGLQSQIGQHVAVRFTAAKGAWEMFLARPFAGMGAGTFHAAFPYYRDPELLGFYRHAHNDWVQWLSELGVLGSALALTTLGTALYRRQSSETSREFSDLVLRGMVLGLAGLCLHACIDFPFRIPGVSVVAAAWLGVLARPGAPAAAGGRSHG